MSKLRFLAFITAITLSLGVGGCVQYPTEKAGVADMRPQLSFSFPADDASLQAARVQVNGIDSGAAGDFVQGKAALRVLPGNNLIRVVAGQRLVYEQQVYLGDGVARTILLK